MFPALNAVEVLTGLLALGVSPTPLLDLLQVLSVLVLSQLRRVKTSRFVNNLISVRLFFLGELERTTDGLFQCLLSSVKPKKKT